MDVGTGAAVAGVMVAGIGSAVASVWRLAEIAARLDHAVERLARLEGTSGLVATLTTQVAVLESRLHAVERGKSHEDTDPGIG